MAPDKDQDQGSLSLPDSHQSQRPHLTHHKSDDSHNNSSDALSSHHHQHRTKHKQHHVGRAHGTRVPSSKALNRHHQPAHVHVHAHAHAHAARPPHRRNPSEPDFARLHQRPAPLTSINSAHLRSKSEVKLSKQNSAVSLTKSVSHSSLKRNRSHAEITKRTRSSDKLKRTASGTGIDSPRQKPGKSQVHFDLGDDPEDEWVDASGSNSPYLSRKGSIVSSGQSSRQGGSAGNSGPGTPNDSHHPPPLSSPERERVNHKAYLTSRLLQRTPSHGAPPQMTPDTVEITPAQASPTSTDRDGHAIVGSGEALTSRFVDGPGSGITPAASFLQTGTVPKRLDLSMRRPQSEANLSRSNEEPRIPVQPDDSALVPRTARRTRAPPAETSRTQQKLNLQRAASSVIEPSQAVAGLGVLPGLNPLIGAVGTSYDGSQSRDPRVTKLMERTGMEYLVVRRYQNPIARSLNRLSKTNGARRIPRPSTATVMSKKPIDLPLRHARNVSMPDARRPETPNSTRRPGTGSAASVRASGAESSFDGEDARRLSGASLVEDEGDGTAALLRNLWDKSTDLSASTD